MKKTVRGRFEGVSPQTNCSAMMPPRTDIASVQINRVLPMRKIGTRKTSCTRRVTKCTSNVTLSQFACKAVCSWTLYRSKFPSPALFTGNVLAGGNDAAIVQLQHVSSRENKSRYAGAQADKPSIPVNTYAAVSVAVLKKYPHWRTTSAEVAFCYRCLVPKGTLNYLYLFTSHLRAKARWFLKRENVKHVYPEYVITYTPNLDFIGVPPWISFADDVVLPAECRLRRRFALSRRRYETSFSGDSRA